MSFPFISEDTTFGLIFLDITKTGERREIAINSRLKATLKTLSRRLGGRTYVL